MRRIVLLLVVALAAGWPALMRADAPARAARPDAPHLELIGQFGGRMQAAAAAGGYAYVGIGPRLAVFDARDPARLVPVGQTAPLGGVVTDVDVAAGRAYVAVGNTLTVFDVGDPPAPAQIAALTLPAPIHDMDLRGDYLYLAADTACLRVISVADPANPVEVGANTTMIAAYAVTVGEQYAYVAAKYGTLRVLDVSDPTNPRHMSAISSGGVATDLALRGERVYQVTGGKQLKVYDVANPRKPAVVATLDLPANAQALTIGGDRLYVATTGVQAYDLADPSAPAPLPLVGDAVALDVAAEGDRLYVADALSVFAAFDFAAPAAPAPLARYAGLDDASGIIVSGRTAVVNAAGDRFVTLDITDVTAPVNLAALAHPVDEFDYQNFFAQGDRVWVAQDSSGVKLADIAAPAAPAWVKRLPLAGKSMAVVAAGDLLYVADKSGSLKIVDVADLDYPAVLRSHRTLAAAQSLALRDGIAYVGEAGLLEIVDIRDPWLTERLGSLPLDGTAERVVARGPLLYLAESGGGEGGRLRIVNIADPAHPTTAGLLELPAAALDVALDQTLAYVACADGLRVIDTRDPAAPQLVTALDTDAARGLALAGDALLVASGAAGLTVYRLEPDGVFFPTLTPAPTATPSATPTATPQGADRYEPDDVCPRGRNLPTDGLTQPRSFHTANDVDWAVMQVTKGARYFVHADPVDGSPADLLLGAYTACNGQPFLQQDYPFSPAARVEFTASGDGAVYLKVTNRWAAGSAGAAAYQLAVRQGAEVRESGSLVLVAGRRADDKLQNNINSVANQAYRVFLNHGYTGDDILYLTTDPGQPGADGPATNAALAAAITEWAYQRAGAGRPLTVYLIDHGDTDRFMLDDGRGEYLAPEELDAWLRAVEDAYPGLKVNVIVEACQSGSFIDLPRSISRPGRVVIASAAPTNNAYAASERGAIFSDRFLDALDMNASLFGAFQSSRWAAYVATRGEQLAWLDDNGDGLPDEPFGSREAMRRGFSYRGTLANELWPPWVAEVTAPPVALGGRATVRARALDDGSAVRVWAAIYPPSYAPPPPAGVWVDDAPLTAPLQPRGDDWHEAALTGLTEPGPYRIVIYAEDADGLSGEPVAVEVAGGEPWPRVWLPLTTGE